MVESITKAIENFCTHQLKSDSISSKNKTPKEDALAAYIDVNNDVDKHRIYLVLEKDFLQDIAKVFFDEDESDDETLKDVALECTNLIVGSAKVIATDKGDGFDISTPNIINYLEIKNSDIIKSVRCNGNAVFIMIEKIN